MQEQLQKIIAHSRRIVFFGGAGVSTESGIPDFRSVDGLYHQKYAVNPEVILSHTYFMNHTEEFYRFYKDKMLCLSAKPNKAHLWLAELEKTGKLDCVVTQNIDGLHQMAGSKKVYELHGSIHRNYCMQCAKTFNASYVSRMQGVPKCDACGGLIKPDVVLYEEALDDTIVSLSLAAIESADTLIIAGTSLTVYPAAGFVQYFNGENIVLINRDATEMDQKANLIIHDNVGEVLPSIQL